MNMGVYGSVYLLPFFVFLGIEAVPPEACFANFRWDDCGQAPTPVMYYWKPGSRCEVGIWRGCLPNLNMFQDEYECATTCIFTSKAMPEDYHSMNENEIEEKTEAAEAETESIDSTKSIDSTESTDSIESTTTTPDAVTTTEGGDTGTEVVEKVEDK